MLNRIMERLRAWGPWVLWPWALLLLGLLSYRAFPSLPLRLCIWLGLVVLLWRGLLWSWRKLVFKVSRRVWTIIVLLSVLPVVALHVFFLSLGYFTLGGQVSRSVQGSLAGLRTALTKASAVPDDTAALQQLSLLGDAWVSRVDALPSGVKPDFVDIVQDINPSTGKPAVMLRAVKPEGARYRLLTLGLDGLTGQSGNLWGGRTQFRLDWDREDSGVEKGMVRVQKGGQEVKVPMGGVQALAWSTGAPLEGSGFFRPFPLPGVSLQATDWATGKGMIFTLTPETSIPTLFAGYGIGDGEKGNVGVQAIYAMAAIALLLLVMAIAQIAAMILGLRLAWSLGGSVDDLHRSVGRLAQGDFSARVRPRSRDQVGVLARNFNDMAVQLEASQFEREKRLSLEEELRIAREVQMRLLPDLATLDLPARVEATLLPAQEVAGDYYDLFRLEDGRLAFLVVDVSGKGTSAAFYAAEVKGMISALDKARHGATEVAARINDLWTKGHRRQVFLTMVYGTFDPATGRFELARCGHPEPLLRHGDGRVELLRSNGLGIGLSAARFREKLEARTGTLEKGDALIICTDGLTEAMDADGRLYGLERLQALLQGTQDDDLRGAILADVTAFAESSGLQDDLTLLIIRS
ncbi:MAG TPA: SpoIIE family protein phosphatase [Holophagaceae bacterium]|nr:SpoIIE family protein phosphatase [Holophagaceae bacterium]